MSGSELLDKMELADLAFVAQADRLPPLRRWARLTPWLAAAACLALAVLLAARRGAPAVRPDAGPDLPLLTVEQGSAAFGFEGYLACSPDELTGVCPWDESMTLETMPVFKNRYPADAAGYAEVEQWVKTEFDPPVELPPELNFSMETATYAETEAVAEYLKQTYADMLAMRAPVADIRGDRTYLGDQQFRLYFYEGDGDVTQRIIARDLCSQWWCGDEQGRLWIVWKNEYDLSEKVGDYPIVSAEEARALLCRGNYITSVPYAMPGGEYIVRVELMYRSDRQAQYFMPYYRFLVELPQERQGDTGLYTYGAYYVPAVRQQYLTEMPVWDGRFN